MKGSQRYLKEVKRQLPPGMKRGERNRVLQCIRGAVTEAEGADRSLSYEALVERIGPPHTLAGKIQDQCGAASLYQLLDTKKFLKRVILGGLAVIVILFLLIYVAAVFDCWYTEKYLGLPNHVEVTQLQTETRERGTNSTE